MRKILSILLMALLLMTNMSFFALANELAEPIPEETIELENISPLGVAYCTSEKNSLWTPVKSMINGKYGGVDGEWQGWECAYPEVSVGQDTSNGFSGEFCGIKFDETYYEIYSLKMNIGIHTLCGGQNATYTVQALVAGKWQDIVILKDDQAVPTNTEKYSCYDDVIADKDASHRVNATLTYVLEEPITTNNVRVVISDYAKNYEGGDVLIFPFIYELELFGKEGEAPDLILPEGASETTNVAWHSYPQAPLGTNSTYPFLAIDSNTNTYWEFENYQGGEYFTLLLDKEYEIGLIEMLFEKSPDKKIQATEIEYFYDGEWRSFENASTRLGTAPDGYYSIVCEISATPMSAVRIKFKTKTELLRLCEVSVNLKDTKTYCFDNRFTQAQIESASNGNLAIIGKTYSSLSFEPYSSDSYINDGVSSGGKVWFTGTLDSPVYCGIKFDYAQKISSATVAVRQSSIIGRENMRFEIQALVDGEYVTLVQGRSYDQNGNYKTSYTFGEVETTDVRVVVLEGHGAIPNVMELELYSNGKENLAMFQGLAAIASNEPEIDDSETEEETDPDAGKTEIPNASPTTDKKSYTWVYAVSIAGALIIACAIIFVIIKKKKQKRG